MINFDPDIVEQCRTGNRMAQMLLYKTFYKRIYNTCYRILRDSSDAEDVMQDSFLKALTGLDKYDGSTPFEAWLVRIAINSSIDKLRRKSLDYVSLDENIGYNIIDKDENDEWEHIKDRVAEVKAAIEKLPESSRLIINLYLIEGYDHEEIAEILNIAPGTSRIQYMRAKQKLIALM
ncbi:MAG: sigma-70 family RNA polymerase sigma factor [Prevotella sp.]|jgi:RNA polymerase sigma-70 factor (ECF subfamily)|nr:sigma-70 family RNA polymerase sigma factor [Prevotella sp.]